MEKGDQRDPKKDTKITTKKNGPLFKEGAKIEAKDHQGDKWWEAKVGIIKLISLLCVCLQSGLGIPYLRTLSRVKYIK
jgi:hypothetical protein